MIRFDEKAILEHLKKLSQRSLVAFAVLASERMLPNYTAFRRQYNWGNESDLRNALDALWNALQANKPITKIKALIEKCEQVTPDTEDFDSILVSSALDAANVVVLALKLTRKCDPLLGLEVARLCRDSVDMYVQEMEKMDSTDPSLEEKICAHQLMQAELQRIDSDIRILSGHWAVADLEKQFRGQVTGSLGILDEK